jgi:betaine reductase
VARTIKQPVIKVASYFLAHAPGLVPLGSKPSRELSKNPALLPSILSHLRTYEEALAYPPHQVFIGNLRPEDLKGMARPWHRQKVKGAKRLGPFGEIMPSEEFYGVLKLADDFNLLWLEEGFASESERTLGSRPHMSPEKLAKLDRGVPLSKIEAKVKEGPSSALPLYLGGQRLVGCVVRGHEEDMNLLPEYILEDLACKATGAMALQAALESLPGGEAEVDYLLGCGEEAVGDRYQRGGGNMAKAIGEMAGCLQATGADIKAFCCGPLHAAVIAGGLVASGIYSTVAVVGGCSLAKLGMKFQGHLKHDMPILEDVLAGVAFIVGEDDGESPVLRLDAVGKQNIGDGSSQQRIVESLALRPLQKLGLKLLEVDKYATEVHDPEVTEPAGSGDVPRTNYRMLAALAIQQKEISKDGIEDFITKHGMPGFSPTQGHIASAAPFLGHAISRMRAGEMERAMFIAKGSLFLGRMTQQSDGLSFLLERNHGTS